MTISAISEDEARAAAGAFIRRRLEASGLVQVEFATPQATAPLPDLQLQIEVETSFAQVQADNPNLKPASVFLKLLVMVQAGQIELVQTEPWAPLQVLPLSR